MSFIREIAFIMVFKKFSLDLPKILMFNLLATDCIKSDTHRRFPLITFFILNSS